MTLAGLKGFVVTGAARAGNPLANVISVFGRTGIVSAAFGDYDTDQIENVSTFPTATLTNVLNGIDSQLSGLAAAIAALTSTSIANASGVAGATVTAALNALNASIAALTSTSIANASGVAGATVTAALNALNASIAALTSTSIANASGVAGATVTAALNALSAADALKADKALAPVAVAASRAFLASDAGKILVCDSASPIVLTFNTAVMTANDVVTILRKNTGAVSIANGTGTVNAAGGLLAASARYAIMSVWFESASVGYLGGERA